VPEAHWDATAGKVKDEGALAKYVNDHVAFKAAEDSRRLTLPQKPEDYKLELSKNFKAPQGVEFKPNENDPVLPLARAFAKKYELSQDAFSELVDLHAAGQIGTMETIKNAKAAELQKLGATGTARMDAAMTWLKAQVGEDLGKHFTQFLYTAQQVEAIEKLMANFRTQGAGSYTPQHGEERTPGKVSQEEYAAMSPGERHEYAKKFPQPHINGGR
jgi:hypothetical protein